MGTAPQAGGGGGGSRVHSYLFRTAMLSVSPSRIVILDGNSFGIYITVASSTGIIRRQFACIQGELRALLALRNEPTLPTARSLNL